MVQILIINSSTKIKLECSQTENLWVWPLAYSILSILILYPQRIIELKGHVFAKNFSVVIVNCYRIPWQPNLSWSWLQPSVNKGMDRTMPYTACKMEFGIFYAWHKCTVVSSWSIYLSNKSYNIKESKTVRKK